MPFKIFLGFMFLHVSLQAGEFTLSSSFLASQTSPKSRAIFKDYERFMNETSSKPLHVKLEAVNFYVNAFVGAYDEQNYGRDEYWASRGEFLADGGGDCEDYVIAKFYTLKDLGVDAKKMGLCVVKDTDRGLWHLILLVFATPKEEPLVLDNLSFKVLPLSKRYDLSIKECMNEEGRVKIEHNAFVADSAHQPFKSYKAMLERNAKEVLWKH